MPTQPTTARPPTKTSDPLLASLAFAVVFNGAAGSGLAREIVTNVDGIFDTGASLVPGRYGMAAASVADSHVASVDFGVMRPLAAGQSWSAFALVKCDDVGNYRAVVAARDAYSGMDFAVELAPGGGVLVGNAANLLAASGAAVAQSVWACVGVSASATLITVYINGLAAYSSAADVRPTAAAPNRVRVGGVGPADSPESLGGSVECVYLWSARALTAADHAALAADPYAFFAPEIVVQPPGPVAAAPWGPNPYEFMLLQLTGESSTYAFPQIIPPNLLLLLEDQPPLEAADDRGDFFTAFFDWFRGDERLNAVFPGGFHANALPLRPSYPCVAAAMTDPLDPLSMDDSAMVMQFSCYATGTEYDAARAGKCLMLAIRNGAARAPLAYGGWREYGCVPYGGTAAAPEGVTKDKNIIFKYTFSATFFVRRADPTLETWPE